MRHEVEYGRRRLVLDIESTRLLAHHRGPASLSDVPGSVRAALDAPFDYPALERGLTPDDRIAVVVEDSLSEGGAALTAILDRVLAAGVSPDAITLVFPESRSSQSWIEDLPEHLEEVQVEEHDPTNQQRLSYLATTRAGRRLYMNRTVVDADCIIVLTERRFDLVLGISGAEGTLFPGLADEAIRSASRQQYHLEAPDIDPWPLRQEAIEVAWLLGQPFYVQRIAGAGGGVGHVVAGAGASAREAERLLRQSWRVAIPKRADVVVVPISGDGSGRGFADLASAVGNAARIVRPAGRVIVLSEGCPPLDAASESLLRAEDAQVGATMLVRSANPEAGPAIQWARGVAHARVSLLSGLPPQTVEDLFATPLENEGQVMKLLAAGGDVVILQDGHSTVALVE